MSKAKNISHATFRAMLPARREPYWHKLDPACYLGFRRGPDTWIARWTDHTSKHHYRSLEATEYSQAKEKAEDWFAQCRGGTVRAGTVEAVCRRYVIDQRREKGDAAAERSHAMLALTVYGDANRGIVPHTIASVRADELTTAQIEDWVAGLENERRSRRTANRILRTFKAALNHGFRKGMAPSDVAWRRVKHMVGGGAKEGSRTDTILTLEQRGTLLKHCTPELADYLRGLLLTAARPGELASATVSDFDVRAGTLRLRTKKGGIGERVRYVPLDPTGIEFFKRMSKDKLPAAPLMTFRGSTWDRLTISIGIRAAVKAANKEAKEPHDRLPDVVVAYTMRHCAISDMLAGGIDVGTVAKLAGTSIRMIDDFYFKFIKTDVAAKLAAIRRV
jgi:integrase